MSSATKLQNTTLLPEAVEALGDMGIYLIGDLMNTEPRKIKLRVEPKIYQAIDKWVSGHHWAAPAQTIKGGHHNPERKKTEAEFMAVEKTKDKTVRSFQKTPGPKPEYLKLDGMWQDCIKKALDTPLPKEKVMVNPDAR